MSICVLSGPVLGCPPLTVAPPVHINQLNCTEEELM